MKQQVIDFLETKKEDNDFTKDLPHSLVAGFYGGSRLHGTNRDESDYDIRTVSILNEDYILGLKEFDHYKTNNGSQGITHAGDLDVEVFHYDSFIKRAKNGEVNAVEMLFAPKDKIIFADAIFQPVLDKKDLFFSKQLVRHYKGMVYRHVQEATPKLEKLKKEERIQRVQTHGYDTKEIMKAIMYGRIMNEFLEAGELNLHRHDREELLQILNGGFSNLEEAKEHIRILLDKQGALMETSLIPEYPDFDKLNAFTKEYNRTILSYIGVLATN